MRFILSAFALYMTWRSEPVHSPAIGRIRVGPPGPSARKDRRCPRVSWFEAPSENFRVPGGGPLHGLDLIRRDYPMTLQGVSLSIEPIESRVKPL